jgi:hypothetical protein
MTSITKKDKEIDALRSQLAHLSQHPTAQARNEKATTGDSSSNTTSPNPVPFR